MLSHSNHTRFRFPGIAAMVIAMALLLAAPLLADDDIDIEGRIQALGVDNLTVDNVLIFVDGNTRITDDDDNPISFSDLNINDDVEVEAVRRGDGSLLATEIEREDDGNDDIEIEGRIQTIGADSLVVNGTTVFVDSNTRVRDDDDAPIAFSDLMVGDEVEIDAMRRLDGSLLALEIEREDDGRDDDDIEIEGRIQAIGADSLVVNGITVYVDGNTRVEDDDDMPIPFSDLMVGDPVEIDAVRLGDGTLLATEIERDDDGRDDDDLEFEGRIQSIGADSLVVNAITVYVDGNTRVEDDDDNPIAFSDLQVGDRVEIHAVLRADGSYYAREIELDDDDDNGGREVELTAPIDAISPDSITVGGLTFSVDANTRVEDDDDNPIPYSDLVVGMIVEIHGRRFADGTLYASKIEVEDFFNDEIEVRGTIDSLFTDALLVGGIRFRVDGNTVVLDDNRMPIAFGDLQVGMFVEVRANRQAGGDPLANRIKVEDRNGNEVEFRAVIDSLAIDRLHAAGMTVFVDNLTLVLDRFNNPIAFSDLQAGDFVEIKARREADGTLMASRIKLEDGGNDGRVDGSVQTVAPDRIALGGSGFAVSNATVIIDRQYQPIALDQIRVGDAVTVWSTVDGDGQTALQVRLNRDGVLSGIGAGARALPEQFELEQNYPNPFNPTTTIPFTLRGNGWSQVSLTVYNALGQEVATLFNGQLDAGSYRFTWDGRANSGQLVASGMYIYRLSVDNQPAAARRMLLIK